MIVKASDCLNCKYKDTGSFRHDCRKDPVSLYLQYASSLLQSIFIRKNAILSLMK